MVVDIIPVFSMVCIYLFPVPMPNLVSIFPDQKAPVDSRVGPQHVLAYRTIILGQLRYWIINNNSQYQILSSTISGVPAKSEPQQLYIESPGGK